jgi:hypothetical protein
MKKQEVYELCRTKASEGYQVHPIILDWFRNYDDIPDPIVEIICHPPSDICPYIECFAKEFEQAILLGDNAQQDLCREIKRTLALVG